MAQYSQSLLDDIRGATDIVDLVGRFVNLRKAGTGWNGQRPFQPVPAFRKFTKRPTRSTMSVAPRMSSSSDCEY